MGEDLLIEKMPGHWLLARMGKRVLRPGGIGLTRKMLSGLNITTSDNVVEFAPGLGVTARLTLAKKPASYTGIEADETAARQVKNYLTGEQKRCIVGRAEHTGLIDHSASVIYGEAMLTMQSADNKLKIIQEAKRLLRPGGRYGIHELCLIPDALDGTTRQTINKALSAAINVGARPLTVAEWRTLLEQEGFTVKTQATVPMHLLELPRMVQDEGLVRTARIAWNVLRNREARKRVMAMRRMFREYKQNLAAVMLVAIKE